MSTPSLRWIQLPGNRWGPLSCPHLVRLIKNRTNEQRESSASFTIILTWNQLTRTLFPVTGQCDDLCSVIPASVFSSNFVFADKYERATRVNWIRQSLGPFGALLTFLTFLFKVILYFEKSAFISFNLSFGPVSDLLSGPEGRKKPHYCRIITPSSFSTSAPAQGDDDAAIYFSERPRLLRGWRNFGFLNFRIK